MLKFFNVLFLLQSIASAINTPPRKSSIYDIPIARTSQTGNCEKGTVYQVRSTNDLKTLYSDQLECIYFAGLAPSKVPEGRLPLTLYSVLNNRLVATLFKDVVSAKMILKISCKKDQATKTYFMGINVTPVGRTLPFLASLMDTTVNVVSGEHTEKLSFIALDYSANFRKLCDDRNPLNDIPNLHLPQGNVFPMSNIFDTLRLIGRDEDGAAILLGKGYFKMGLPEGIYTTVNYIAITSLDDQLNPEFAKGEALPPLKQGFSYRTPSFP